MDGDSLSAVLVAGPSNGTLALGADGSFTYTPGADSHGTDSFTYRAADGNAESNLATVTITVNPVNDAPVASDDLAAAPPQWLREALNDLDESVRRQQSDFLAESNHDGQSLDFHALWHTGGAWLAMAGASPKAVQTVMRHRTITLTMDTYGHLFPSQEIETVARARGCFRMAATS